MGKEPLKTRPCFVCRNDNVKHFMDWEAYEYVECLDCGLIYIGELPGIEAIMPAYQGNGWKALRRKLISPFRSFSMHTGFREANARVKRIFDRAKRLIPLQENGQMLDIGCNKGFLLSQGVEAGMNVYGIEIVPVLMDQFKPK